MNFSPAIQHPNVFKSGQVALDLADEWKPTFTLKEIINEIYNFLKEPNVENPSNVKSAFSLGSKSLNFLFKFLRKF